MNSHLLWAPHAWINGQWQRGVCLGVNTQGFWTDITANIHTPPAGATVLPGPVLPGMVNAHSHAFQRAFAGLSERRESDSDDFWSWRDRMYGVALRITPAQMHAVAAQLYVEMLKGGYTQVCEFHYLHHTEGGSPYDDPAILSWALADAAEEAGLGLTLLPVLYERAGFAQPALRDDQRRFAGTPEFIHSLYRSVQLTGRARVNAGVAIHSLRAASRESITTLKKLVGDDDVPIHIHVAEQMQEVNDCLTATGARPIEWLCREFAPDHRWQLVHATHATAAEINSVASAGAGMVICPSTEGNLGDGLADLPAWLAAQVPMAIGSDSHVSRSWAEELRWLEYGQRLNLQRRNVATAPALGQPSTAARLFEAALDGGRRAAGAKKWGLTNGARADALVLNTQSPGLLGIAPTHLLDALVFATNAPAVREVYVAGKHVVADGRHLREEAIAGQFADVMKELWDNVERQ